MVIDKICRMSIKGVKLKSESFFSISPGVLELWRKNLGGGGIRPPGPDRVNPILCGGGFLAPSGFSPAVPEVISRGC